MPSPDTFAAIALVAAVLLAAFAICRTEPGGLARMLRTGHHTGVWLDARDVPAAARYGPYDGQPAARPMSVLETVPDPVSPYAPKTRTA